MKNVSILAAILFVSFVACSSQSVAQETTKADKAIKAVKDLCLSGSQFDLKADGKGNLTFLKLVPGAKGSVSVNVRESAGAAALFDEKLRKEADEDIRNCIKPYIQKIINAILDDNASVTGAVSPNLLVNIITTQQIANVRKSYGERAGQNFSDRDLNQFIRQGRATIIANELKKNRDYLEVVLAIKRMNPTARNDLYTRAYETYRPTWAELGKIDSAGQTEAGQEADKMIAQAIVEMTQDLLLMPDEEIKRLSN
ncbi:MAG: hypothetical protein N838_14805 [Thiohalocapsa sp. PB-PSB1]|jgi:hypothetical protein|nr:MAG: hypothetical protein N838_30450 [Thiohalocapsa sp. PB-PSB1]QQO54425.1 MAG: hypothetical protein N838_14805 [Thiohalocapsa sp. PB-PSB1]HCS92432.1 hypothetical protein [Chromatiaceae bacterium]